MTEPRTRLPLFDRPLPRPPSVRFREVARSRNTDPDTSFRAALAVEESGRAATQRGMCLVIVLKAPGHTAAEIARMARLERHIPSRRLPELRTRCLVNNAPNGDKTEAGADAAKRICRVEGTRQMTWWPAKTIRVGRGRERRQSG